LFPILTAPKDQGHQGVLRFCIGARAYREQRPPWARRFGPPRAWRIILTTCKSRIKNNICLQTSDSGRGGLTTLVLLKEDVR
jgi:hypothetical protein